MITLRFLTCCLCALLFTLLGAPTTAAPQTDDPLYEIAPEIQATKDRTESEQDRIAAAAWFTQARVQFQREDFAHALRSYQRAWRYDQDATSILREIVPLAFELKRNAEAARYAVIMAEKNPRDALLLRRLAQHLIDQREYARAIGLYEKSLALQLDEELDGRHVLSQMEIGRLYFIEDMHDRAADSFAIVVDALEHPDKYKLTDKTREALLGEAAPTYALFGEAFLDAGRLEEATAMFEKANDEESAPPLLAYRLARIDMKNDRPQAALKQLEKYLSSTVTDAGTSALQLLEETLNQLHDAPKAKTTLRKRLEELHKEDETNLPLKYFLAEKYSKWNEPAKAADLFESAIAETPTVSGYSGLIRNLLKLDDDARLIKALSGAISGSGSISRLGSVVDELTEDEARTKQIIEQAWTQAQNDDADKHGDQALALGLLAIKAKQFDKADDLLAHAADSDEERRPAIMESWGLQMFINDEFERATKVFKQAIDEEVAPRFNADFYYYLAGTLEFAGETDNALEAAKKAAELDKDSARYASRAAWVLYHAEQYDLAKKAYLEFLAKYEEKHDDADVRDAIRQARLILSNIEIQSDNMEAAEEWLEKVLDEFPEDIGAMNDLGYLWSDQGKHLQRSLRMVTAAAEAEPDNVAYRDSVGWAYYRLGKFDQAIKELEVAASGDIPDGVMYDHLGDAYQAGGRTDDAITAWQKAVELFEEDEEGDKAEETRQKIKTAQQN